MLSTRTYSFITTLMLGIVLSFLMISNSAFAQDPACAKEPLTSTSYCQNQQQQSAGEPNPIVGPDGLLNKVIDIVTTITAIISVIVIVVGGIMYAVSSGDPQGTNRARNAIIYALVGLVISVLVREIVIFVLNRVGDSGAGI